MKKTRESRPKLSFFPDAPIGVSMFSRCIAYHQLSGNATLPLTKIRLFGSLKPYATDQFGACIPKIKEVAPPFLNLDYGDLLENATLFGFYSAALAPSRRQIWRADQIGRRSIQMSRFFGGYAGRKLYRPTPHLCTSCVLEDESNFGIGFWHLVHQIPGVHHCPRHYTLLIGACHNCGLPQASEDRWNPPSSICPCCLFRFDVRDTVSMSDGYRNYLHLCDSVVRGEDVGLTPLQRLRTYTKAIEIYGSDGSLAVAGLIKHVLERWDLATLQELQAIIGSPISKDFFELAIKGRDTMLDPVAHLMLLAAILPLEKCKFARTTDVQDAQLSDKSMESNFDTSASFIRDPKVQIFSAEKPTEFKAQSFKLALCEKGMQYNLSDKRFNKFAETAHSPHIDLGEEGALNWNDHSNVRNDCFDGLGIPDLSWRETQTYNLRKKHRLEIREEIALGHGTRQQAKVKAARAVNWCRRHDEDWLDANLPLAQIKKECWAPVNKDRVYKRRILDYLENDCGEVLCSQIADAMPTELKWIYQHDKPWLEALLPALHFPSASNFHITAAE